jgi:penicillin-binding protein 1B
VKARWVIIAAGSLAVAGAAAYVVRLDRMVTREFKGRHWTLPAQVYAAPLELYAGLPLSPGDIEATLRRLGYRRVAAQVRTGTYREADGQFEVGLRATRFAEGARAAETLYIATSGGTIASLRDAQGRTVPIIRLDPLLIGSIFPIHGEDRIVVTPSEVPPLLPRALVAVEDRDFYTNIGIDPTAMLRALWVDLRAGAIKQGGSTLTQQLVKSIYLSPRRTLWRKIREAIMAVSLEMHFSKSDLMNTYINEIHLGQDGNRAIDGFGLASEFYFGTPLDELDVDQIATLVALVRGPSYYNPRRHPQRTLARRNLVLREMSEQHVITAAAAAQAQMRPLGVTAKSEGAYYPAYLDLVRATLRRDYPEQELTETGLRVFTNLDPRVQADAERILEQRLTYLDRLHRHKGGPLEGAVVVTAPQSGDVIAVVGGRDSGFDGFNRALDGYREIGSLVKPFVYLAAMESGRYNPTSIIDDEPVSIRLSNGRVWRPKNYTRENYGPVPLVRALADSLNDASVNLGMDVGLDKVIHVLQQFGLTRTPPEDPSLLLGAIGLSPLEVAQLYGGLANGGFRTELRAVRAVISADGKPLKAFQVELQAVAPAAAVYEVDSMLEQVVEQGTGRPARAILPPGLVVAGKTGTGPDLRDSWFAGFSGDQLAVVWVGYDDDSPTHYTGESGALSIWSRLMAETATSSWSEPMPDSLEDVTIDFDTGFSAGARCSDDLVMLPVPAGTPPPPLKPGCSGAPLGATLQGAAHQLLHRVVRALAGLVH